jgi:hypothetical protein
MCEDKSVLQGLTPSFSVIHIFYVYNIFIGRVFVSVGEEVHVLYTKVKKEASSRSAHYAARSSDGAVAEKKSRGGLPCDPLDQMVPGSVPPSPQVVADFNDGRAQLFLLNAAGKTMSLYPTMDQREKTKEE